MDDHLGFIGLGVMGSRMCANLIRRSERPVHVFDPVGAAVGAAVDVGAVPEPSVAAVGSAADTVFLSLPSITQVEEVARELLSATHPPRLIVDMSTSDVTRTRSLGRELAGSGVTLIDAPVARRRQAAEDGTLLITVGGDESTFNELQPLLLCMGSDIIPGGALGNGQALKILNNMVLFLNTHALAEALTIGRAAGVEGSLLFDTLQMGSADSFALRTTARQTMLPDEFPEQAFPVDYAIKDLALALDLADASGVDAIAARNTMDVLRRTSAAGLGQAYYPALIRVVDGRD